MKATSETTVLTLGCAINLTGQIVREIMGAEVAATLKGEQVSQKQLLYLAAQRITRLLLERKNQQAVSTGAKQ